MEKPKFEFIKRDGKYVFIMDSKDIHREETVDKDYVKKHYNELLNQRNEALENMKKINKDLEKFSVEKDAELENFIALANRAADYNKMLTAQANRDSILDMLERINESIKKIENVIPELKRQGK